MWTTWNLPRQLLVLCAALLAGCVAEPRVRASVEAFSTLETAPTLASVSIAPAVGVDGTTLEFATYRERLAAALVRRGFRVLPGEAEWRARLGFGIDDGREVTQSLVIPAYGYPWPGRASRHDGPWWPGGYRTEVRSATVYTRHLVIALQHAQTGEEAWRVRVVSRGRCPSLSSVFDALLAAAFEGFPASGTRTVDVMVEEAC